MVIITHSVILGCMAGFLSCSGNRLFSCFIGHGAGGDSEHIADLAIFRLNLEGFTDGSLPTLKQVLRLLSSYAYLWSRESLDDFAGLFSNQSQASIPVLSQTLVVHPLTQLFFQTALRPVFEKLHTDCDLVQELTNSLIRTAPLLPVFLRQLIAGFPGKHVLFFDAFLEHFSKIGLRHFSHRCRTFFIVMRLCQSSTQLFTVRNR
jgi:hypothetical protein